MADKKISQLDSASSVSSGAYFPISQSGTTYKGTTDQIGEQIAKNQDFSELNTTSKKVIGAINEVLAGSDKDIINAIDTPAPIMTFNDGGDNIPVNKLLVAVTATQSGSGTPSPSNPRAITGWSQAQISVSDGVTPQTVIIPFGDTYYGGILDVTNGKLTVTHKLITYDGSSDEIWNQAANGGFYIAYQVTDAENTPPDFISNIYVYGGDVNSSAGVTENNTFYSQIDKVNIQFSRVWIKDTACADVTALKTFLSNNPLNIVYLLDSANQNVINLTPAQIATLSGTNNIYADCGDIQLLEYFNENADEVAELNRAMSDDFHIYSTAEQIVGKWFGDDLYEKSYHYEQASCPAQGVPVTIDNDTSGLNIESIAMFFCTYKIHQISGNYDQWITDSTTTTQINNNQLLFYQKATSQQQNYNNLEVNITIRYTKAS